MFIINSIFLNLMEKPTVMFFNDWLIQVEAVIDYKHYEDPKRVQLVETKLSKGAMHWWRSLHTQETELAFQVLP